MLKSYQSLLFLLFKNSTTLKIHASGFKNISTCTPNIQLTKTIPTFFCQNSSNCILAAPLYALYLNFSYKIFQLDLSALILFKISKDMNMFDVLKPELNFLFFDII